MRSKAFEPWRIPRALSAATCLVSTQLCGAVKTRNRDTVAVDREVIGCQRSSDRGPLLNQVNEEVGRESRDIV